MYATRRAQECAALASTLASFVAAVSHAAQGTLPASSAALSRQEEQVFHETDLDQHQEQHPTHDTQQQGTDDTPGLDLTELALAIECANPTLHTHTQQSARGAKARGASALQQGAVDSLLEVSFNAPRARCDLAARAMRWYARPVLVDKSPLRKCC